MTVHDAGGHRRRRPLRSRRRGGDGGSRHRASLGPLFSAPYLIFLAVIFAYPLGFAVYMSLHDYFFTAPGVSVERPFIGVENYVAALTDPAVRRSFVNVGIFLLINVPLTVVLSLVLATLLNQVVRARAFLRVSFYLPYLTASVAVVGVWLFLFSGSGLVNQLLGPLAPDPTWLINERLGDAVHRLLRHLEAARVLHPAVPGGPAERRPGAVRGGRHRRRLAGCRASGTSPCPGSGRRRCWCCCWPR